MAAKEDLKFIQRFFIRPDGTINKTNEHDETAKKLAKGLIRCQAMMAALQERNEKRQARKRAGNSKIINARVVKSAEVVRGPSPGYEWLSALAKEVGYSRNPLYKAIERGELDARKNGSWWECTREAFEQYRSVQAQMRGGDVKSEPRI